MPVDKPKDQSEVVGEEVLALPATNLDLPEVAELAAEVGRDCEKASEVSEDPKVPKVRIIPTGLAPIESKNIARTAEDQQLLEFLRSKKRIHFDYEIDSKIRALMVALSSEDQPYKELLQEVVKDLNRFVHLPKAKLKHYKVYLALSRHLLVSELAEVDPDDSKALEKIIISKAGISHLEDTYEYNLRDIVHDVFILEERYGWDKYFRGVRGVIRSFKQRRFEPIKGVGGYMILAVIALVADLGILLGLDLPIRAPVKTIHALRHNSCARRKNEANKELKQQVCDAYVKSLPEEEDELAQAVEDNPEKLVAIVNIKQLGFPVMQKTEAKEAIDPKKPNVFICGTSDDTYALARELDKQGGVNVILSNSANYSRNAKKITLKDGIVYKDGKLYYFDKKFKLKPAYICNFAARRNQNINKGKVPTAEIPFIDEYTENKELSNAVLNQAGIDVPASITWRSELENHFLDKLEKDGVLEYKRVALEGIFAFPDSVISCALDDFIQANDCDEIVVKPADGAGGQGIEFFNKANTSDAARKVVKLLKGNHNVIVEERIKSAPINLSKIFDMEMPKVDWNLRVFVSRDENGDLVVDDKVVRVDKDGKPVNISLTAKATLFERICGLLELSPEQADKLKKQIDSIAIRSCEAIDEAIRSRHKIKAGKQQDRMGVDVIVSQDENGEFTPYMIEVNDHHAGGMWDLDNVLPAQEHGRACRNFAKTIIKRAKAA